MDKRSRFNRHQLLQITPGLNLVPVPIDGPPADPYEFDEHHVTAPQTPRGRWLVMTTIPTIPSGPPPGMPLVPEPLRNTSPPLASCVSGEITGIYQMRQPRSVDPVTSPVMAPSMEAATGDWVPLPREEDMVAETVLPPMLCRAPRRRSIKMLHVALGLSLLLASVVTLLAWV